MSRLCNGLAGMHLVGTVPYNTLFGEKRPDANNAQLL